MAAIVGSPEREPLVLRQGLEKKENPLVVKTDESFRSHEAALATTEIPKKTFFASLKINNPTAMKVVAVGLILFIGLGVAGLILINRPTSTALQCRPTQMPSLTRRGFEYTDPRLLPSHATFIPAQLVEEEVIDNREAFDHYEKLALEKWKYLNHEQEAKTAAVLAKRSKDLAESFVTCLTGQLYGSQAFHATLAQFMGLPFSPTDQFEPLFINLRSLNQNFSQPIGNPLFAAILDEFKSNAMTRNKEEMLDSNGNWITANFDPWISTVKDALLAYTKGVANAFFNDLDPLVTAAIGPQTGFKQLADAPPRDQIVALQQIQDQVVAKLCAGGLNPKQKEALQSVHFGIMNDTPYSQYSALTGKSYYARLDDNPFKVVYFDETSVALFKWLYWWSPEGSSAYQFKQVWENNLQYYIDQGVEGFDEESVQNLVYALQSVAESRNGTKDYWEHETIVNMRPALEVIYSGVRFGNETWTPTHKPLV